VSASAREHLSHLAVAAPTPLVVFGVLLAGAAGVNVAGGWPPYWTVAGLAGLAAVVLLERRAERRAGPRGRLLAALVFSAALLAAVRVTAEVTGSIVAADTVLGLVLLLEGVLLRARGLVLGGAACAVLALAAGAVVGASAVDAVVSLTSGVSLLAAALVEVRQRSRQRPGAGAVAR
jgi:hypothetical protein